MDQKSGIKILIVGGDDRLYYLYQKYKKDGFYVNVYGQENINKDCQVQSKELKELIKEHDIIIGPIPFSIQNNLLNMKYSNIELKVYDFISMIGKDKVLFGGAINSDIRKITLYSGLRIYDYNEDEIFKLSNAKATAESAIAIIIQETKKTIYKSNIMILGYGRIGKILADYLRILGANVYVASRKKDQLKWIEINGMTPVDINYIANHIEDMDLVINTIPSIIIDEKILDCMNKNTIIFELASNPGGVDFAKSIQKSIKVIKALGLPGKFAPVSAADYIFESVNRTIINI